MMLCLALRSDAERVYRRALRQFSVDEITEGFAAARGLALPSQLRRLLRERGRDLHAEFIKLLPTPPRPIRIQRWSVRRVGLWAAIALLVVLASLNPTAVFDNQVAVRTPLNTGNLSCAHLEPLWLMAQSVPSAPLVQRYQRIDLATDAFGATWYDRFPGGCVTYRLHSTSDVEGSFAIELPGLLGFATRDGLREALRQRSDGRLHLDPREP